MARCTALATKRGAGVDRATTIKRALIGVVLLAALFFAVQGGEWSTLDLLRQRQRLARMEKTVDSLQTQVDSLKAYKKALETDPVLQEKIAREEFGMVRGNKELLYRFTTPEKRDTGQGKRR